MYSVTDSKTGQRLLGTLFTEIGLLIKKKKKMKIFSPGTIFVD